MGPLATEKSKPNKYRNKWTVCARGQKHQSKREAKRCDVLTMLERQGQIRNLTVQVRIPLIAWASYGGNVKVADYIADFRYERAGVTVVEDVKSPITRKESTYRLKRKLFAANYGFEITEV